MEPITPDNIRRVYKDSLHTLLLVAYGAFAVGGFLGYLWAFALTEERFFVLLLGLFLATMLYVGTRLDLKNSFQHYTRVRLTSNRTQNRPSKTGQAESQAPIARTSVKLTSPPTEP